MSMLSNLDLIRRVPLFSMLTADQAQSIADSHACNPHDPLTDLLGLGKVVHRRVGLAERLGEAERQEKSTEFRFTLADEWSRRLFASLCRRYGLDPYRYKGQRHTTVETGRPDGA